MLKQRNLYIRPENNAEAGKREMSKLENFGWTKVRETALDDGSFLVSYVRDTDEDAEAVANERKYRSAVLAKAYAETAMSRITALNKSGGKKANLAGAIIFGFFAVVFTALAAVAAVWTDLYKLIFGLMDTTMIKLAGGWAFYNYRQISMITGIVYIQILFTMVLGAVAVLFFGLCFSSIRKRRETNLNIQDYADFSVEEFKYYNDVIAEASKDMYALYPAGEESSESADGAAQG